MLLKQRCVKREVASIEVAVLLPSSCFTTTTTVDTSLGMLKKTQQAVPPEYCLLDVSIFSDFSCPSYCRMLPGSGAEPSAHQAQLTLVPCTLCYASSPLFFHLASLSNLTYLLTP